MDTIKSFDRDLYSVNDGNFGDIALQLFHFQLQNNGVYRDYVRHLGVDPGAVVTLEQIPFLPISFFKNHEIKTGAWTAETSFASSGTTGQRTSAHPVRSLRFYHEHAVRCFAHFFGDLSQYHFFALLPSYLERSGSSLVAMISNFIEKSRSNLSGFYLHNVNDLLKDLERSKTEGKKAVLWGVTFALLDLAERYHPDLRHCLIFETGGMKGRRQEIIRQELHSRLRQAFRVDKVYSEYGMTELFSQAYTRGGNAFYCPPWMRVLGRDISDPMEKGLLNETAGINVIDLANVDSIAFIETEDLGRVNGDGSFEVLGRIDNSDVRGCSLMVE